MLASTAPDIATCRAPSVVTSIPAIGAETQDITHASNKQVGRFTWWVCVNMYRLRFR